MKSELVQFDPDAMQGFKTTVEELEWINAKLLIVLQELLADIPPVYLDRQPAKNATDAIFHITGERWVRAKWLRPR